MFPKINWPINIFLAKVLGLLKEDIPIFSFVQWKALASIENLFPFLTQFSEVFSALKKWKVYSCFNRYLATSLMIKSCLKEVNDTIFIFHFSISIHSIRALFKRTQKFFSVRQKTMCKNLNERPEAIHKDWMEDSYLTLCK